jgi:hypothetical protein
VADPDLVLEDRWLKVFTVLYQLVGIGNLVEILPRPGFVFVTIRAQYREALEPARTSRRRTPGQAPRTERAPGPRRRPARWRPLAVVLTL